MKANQRLLLRFLLALFVVVGIGAWDGGIFAADSQRLSKEQVAQVATDYATENKLIRGSQPIKDISFNPETKSWLVLFGSDPSGNGYFGLTISDADPKNITLQKGL